MNKRFLISFSVFIIIAAGAAWFLQGQKPPPEILPTYFQYSDEELEKLRALKLKSKREMTVEDVYVWDKRAFNLVSNGTLVTTGFDPDTGNIYAYLAVAHYDAARLSFNATQRFSGSLDPVSREVLCLSFPNDCARISGDVDSDEYSEALAEMVLVKIKARIAEDRSGLRPSQKKIGDEYWTGPEPMIGIQSASAKPWFLQSANKLNASPPPAFGSPQLETQLQQTQEAVRTATNEQKKAVVFWAGGPGTKTPPGIWLEIADEYMREHSLPFSRVLEVRVALTAGMADALSASFHAKYTYWVKRPVQLDPSLITVMPTPNHPSYPAGHSVVSSAAGALLTYAIPEAGDLWKEKVEEAGLSRIWGGIHFPMDHEQGSLLGERVAQEVIANMPASL